MIYLYKFQLENLYHNIVNCYDTMLSYNKVVILITGMFSLYFSQFSNTSMPICRICHDTDIREELISPCRCSGTMGLIHRSCIEKWLGASNSDRCEICSFRFIIKRSPRPFVDVSFPQHAGLSFQITLFISYNFSYEVGPIILEWHL